MENNLEISFAFTGDINLGSEYIKYAQRKNLDFLYPFTFIESELFKGDITVFNLEGPIGKGKQPRPGVSALLFNHPSILKLFTNRILCVLNISNNHIMDYGAEGLNGTLKLLRNNKIPYVGAGDSSEEANRELIIEHKGKRIAFLSYTSDERHIGAIIANGNKAGCESYLKTDTILKRIRGVRKQVDILCVSLHWGYEYYSYPSPEQRDLAHRIADAGAHYIIGHHPHAIQGIEYYSGSLILYSLGNLFMPRIRAISGRLLYQKAVEKEFLIVNSEINNCDKPTCRMIGGIVDKDYSLKLYENEKYDQFILRIRQLSEPFTKDSHESYQHFWANYKKTRERELQRERLFEAFKKLTELSIKEIISMVTFDDIKRNFKLLLKLMTSRKV